MSGEVVSLQGGPTGLTTLGAAVLASLAVFKRWGKW